MLLTRSSNSQASRHSDPCHSPPGTYRRVYHTLQIIFGWSLQGPHPLQAALRLLDPFGPPRISRRALKTSLRLPYDLLGPPFPPRLSKDPPKFPKKIPKPAWHVQKGLPHLTNHSFVIVCTRGHGCSSGLRVGNPAALFPIFKATKK